jgi:hypothetical protein
MAATGGLVVRPNSINLEICRGIFPLIKYIPEKNIYKILDRFKRSAVSVKCEYQAAEDYLCRVLLLPSPTLPPIHIPNHRRISKFDNYILIDYQGHNYHVCGEYIFVCDGRSFRFVARGSVFSDNQFRYTDDDLERLIQLALDH